MCLVEAMACWHATIELIGAKEFIHYWHMDTFFYNSVYWTNKSEEDALQTLRRSNVILFQLMMFFSLGLNLCKCLDMIFTISDPFYPAHRRMKWYYLTSLIVSFLFTFCSIGEGIGLKHSDTNTVFQSAFTVTVISAFFIVSIYSAVTALRLTTRPGISRNMRKHFSYAHMK